MTVRAKQKTLNSNTTTPLITYRSSSTFTPPSAPASCPSSSSPDRFSLSLLLEIFKNWKEVGDNMHHKHVVLWFGTEIISPLKGQQRLCTWQWTKIKIHWQLIWPYSCLKEMETYEILTNLTFRNQLCTDLYSTPFWKLEKGKKSRIHNDALELFPHFRLFGGRVLGSYRRKRHDVTVTWPFETIFHRTKTVKI